ncbi:hypothetical protein [Acidovorax sp. NCPPB 4044]|uniref:hypothetical protein n=1 Tax=Acidovorax sp. NCPPB 4044 TaxID=2940490 RepID=UPI00230202D1|nr:hypothetical protein [Acidovorax sp. NCPPB 4044]MDA8522326.1 hypothetical protein [Acidovorax sp. NCPPB 4044]
MKDNDELPLAPVAGWQLKSIPAYGALVICFDYLSHETQTPEEAQQSQNFVLNTAQARELAQRILVQCDKLESGPPQGTGLPKH